MHHSHIDRFAHGDSPIHRLDARAKLLAVLVYTAILISFDRYSVAILAPMAILPLAMLWIGRIPTWFALRRVAVAGPLILMMCLMSPFYDASPRAAALGPWGFQTTGGWLTAADIAIKFIFGIFALTALTGSTPFSALLEAMRRLAIPRLLVMQLGFLYRYIFVLLDEAMRMKRARDFRGAAMAPAGRRLAATGGIVGCLFVRTLERSDRVHAAMVARGYDGTMRAMDGLAFRWADAVFLLATVGYCGFCRFVYPAMVGL